MGMKLTDLEKVTERHRQKIELWRAKRKKDELDQATEDSEGKAKKKSWNLEDEDDEDEFGVTSEVVSTNGGVQKEVKEEVKMEVDDEEEEDPLDAFMKGIAQKQKPPPKSSGVVTIIQEEKEEPEKGQVLENEDNTDMVIDDFDIETAAASLCHKGRMLAQTDHTKVYYRKFKKNFYIEVRFFYLNLKKLCFENF